MADSRYFVIWIVLMVFLPIGCATEANRIPKSFEYVSLQPGERFAMVFDVEDMTVTPQIESHLGVPPSKLEVCNNDSSYICFASDIDNLNFSFPKKLNERRSWSFQNRQFDIIEEIKTINCGTDYIVRAEKEGVPTEIFKFNYGKGLTAIYYILNIEEIKLEFVSGKTYQFGEILIANGIGFGAVGNCLEGT